PNDLMIDGAKTAGILVETTHAAGRQIAVVGIGVNIAGPPQVAARPTTSLSAAGITTTPDHLLDRLNAAFATRLPDWSANGGFADIRADWLARGPHLGAEIAVHADGTHVSGLFAGLDGDGALLLADETTTGPRRFTFGDVALLRHR
ncbi:MAG: biotin--[acetyl-CoA-carboxylase] ligase, partial [Pseudomonadota bacterium]